MLPIGGADMPVVVSMLNSYSGWAAAAFRLHALNRCSSSPAHWSASPGRSCPTSCHAYEPLDCFDRVRRVGGAAGVETAVARPPAGREERSGQKTPFLMSNASKVVIVPGYGMAVA